MEENFPAVRFVHGTVCGHWKTVGIPIGIMSEQCKNTYKESNALLVILQTNIQTSQSQSHKW